MCRYGKRNLPLTLRILFVPKSKSHMDKRWNNTYTIIQLLPTYFAVSYLPAITHRVCRSSTIKSPRKYMLSHDQGYGTNTACFKLLFRRTSLSLLKNLEKSCSYDSIVKIHMSGLRLPLTKPQKMQVYN